MDEKQIAEIVRRVISQINVVQETAATYHTIPERAERLSQQGLCLWCEESLVEDKSIRGLHSRCYRALLRDLEKRGQTIEWAVSIGAALPEAKSGRKHTTLSKLDQIAAESKPSINAEHAVRSAEAQRKAAPYAKPKPGTEAETEKKLKPKKNSG